MIYWLTYLGDIYPTYHIRSRMESKNGVLIIKCGLMRKNAKSSTYQANRPIAYINNKQLELVSSYKYLGIDINIELDWSEKWVRIQKRITPVLYLLKRLKQCAFDEKILVSVYRSYVLSHISYSSPAFPSVSISTATEIQGVQSRALKIIGLTECNALKTHGITTVRDFIANTCVNVLKRISCDPTHPLTIKHTREIQRFTMASFPFEYSRARTVALLL